MSDSALLKTIRELREIGALDVAAITGVPIPGGNRTRTISIQELGLPGIKTYKDLGMLLEAVEIAEAFFREKAPLQFGGSTEARSRL
jgi:hypothetical protein